MYILRVRIELNLYNRTKFTRRSFENYALIIYKTTTLLLSTQSPIMYLVCLLNHGRSCPLGVLTVFVDHGKYRNYRN